MDAGLAAVALAGVSLLWQIVDHVRAARARRPKLALERPSYSVGVTEGGYVRGYLGVMVCNRGGAPAQISEVGLFLSPQADAKSPKGRVAGRGRAEWGASNEAVTGPQLPAVVNPFESVEFRFDVSFLDPGADTPTALLGYVESGDGVRTLKNLEFSEVWLTDARRMSEERRRGDIRRVDLGRG